MKNGKGPLMFSDVPSELFMLWIRSISQSVLPSGKADKVSALDPQILLKICMPQMGLILDLNIKCVLVGLFNMQGPIQVKPKAEAPMP